MQLRKFEAPTIQEALRKIKAELGEDAVIFDLHTRCQRSKNRHPAGIQWVEVTAAIERNGAALPDQPASTYGYNGRSWSAPAQGDTAQQPAAPPANAGSGDAARAVPVQRVPWHATSCSPCIKNMLVSGFSQEAAGYLLGEAAAEQTVPATPDELQRILLQKIASHVAAAGPITMTARRQKRVAFVGPTGVGKTTTLAKVAAHFVRNRGIKIKIISIDTYRIAAAEQLKIYGRIMNVPVAVAATVEDLGRELEQCDDAQLVLIDTAGRNYRDGARMAALGSWLARYPDIETHLLLCATTTPDVLEATVSCFAKNRIDRVIITKVDESVRQGHLYETLVAADIPVSYITNGQRVPEDMLPASAPMLAELFLNGYTNQVAVTRGTG